MTAIKSPYRLLFPRWTLIDVDKLAEYDLRTFERPAFFNANIVVAIIKIVAAARTILASFFNFRHFVDRQYHLVNVTCKKVNFYLYRLYQNRPIR